MPRHRCAAEGLSHGIEFAPAWQCAVGFQSKDEACIPIELPVNALIDPSGKDWDCDRPYLQQQDECVLH